ncbi:MAG: SLC13 family permease [Pleurocapsa sp. CRU_1_2]|nr:SLC13 family permease [Pleurocapsa sp. CRU_1_2]
MRSHLATDLNAEKMNPKIILQSKSNTYLRSHSYWRRKAFLIPLLITIAAIVVSLPDSLAIEGRLALFTFLIATILWSITKINAAYIATGSAIALVLTGTISQEEFFASLGSDVVWLMIGAFILGDAVKQTGLAARLTQIVVAKANSVGNLFWLLTTVLIPLSFLIPSTSGRAAVTYPVFRSISTAIEDKKIRRTLCLLMPTIILVSTIVSLTGAGSHLVANDLLEQIAKQEISFGQWVLYGLPFGVIASYLSCWVISRMFLNKRQLQQPLTLPQVEMRSLTAPERKTLGITLLMLVFWLTESWHGLEIATVTVIGAVLLTMPKFGVIQWKNSVKAVSWNLILFVAATLVLGHSLIDSGASQWIFDHIFDLSEVRSAQSNLIIFILLAVISLTSHLYMTSHTARAAALVPPLLYLATSLNVNPVAVMFLSTLGMDYCLTFPVSSKALLVYQELDEGGFKPKDLLRLSSVLIAIHLVLMVLFYFTWWHWVGLSL